MLGQETVDDAPDVRREEALAVHLDVLAILERRDDTRVGRRPANTVLFERLHEACLGKAWRWLREVLFRAQLDELDRVAFGNLGQQSVPVIVLAVVVPALLVHSHEAGLNENRSIGAQTVSFRRIAGREIDGNRVEQGRHHLAGHGALPDQRVELVLFVVE